MNLHHLSVFHEVAKAGNFTAAAERLMTSQPVVSRQIAALEKTLHVQLVERLPRGVKLTEAGALLAEYAARIFALDSDAGRALAELRGLERGRLAIGASLTIGACILPTALAAFRKLHPGVELQVEIGNSAEVQRRLIAGELDVGFTEGLGEAEGLESRVFGEDELVAIVAAGDALARERVTVRRLCEEPMIFREVGSGSRAVVERALTSKGMRVRPVMSLGSTEAIKGVVASGMGVGIVSRLAIGAEVKAGILSEVGVTDLRIRRELWEHVVKGRWVGRAAEVFLGIMRGKRKGRGG